MSDAAPMGSTVDDPRSESVDQTEHVVRIVVAGCILVFTLVYLVASLSLPFQARALPFGFGVVTAVLAVGVLLVDVLAARREPRRAARTSRPVSSETMVAFAVVCGAPVAELVAGSVIGLAIYLVLVYVFFAKIAPWRAVVTAIVLTGALFYVFHQVLGIAVLEGLIPVHL